MQKLAVLLVFLVFLAGCISQSSGQATTTSTILVPITEKATLKEALSIALSEAQKWKSQARLAHAAADMVDQYGKADEWKFLFDALESNECMVKEFAYKEGKVQETGEAFTMQLTACAKILDTRHDSSEVISFIDAQNPNIRITKPRIYFVLEKHIRSPGASARLTYKGFEYMDAKLAQLVCDSHRAVVDIVDIMILVSSEEVGKSGSGCAT